MQFRREIIVVLLAFQRGLSYLLFEWHHQYADHDFGSCQAKELLDHLESVLAVSKGLVVEKLLKSLINDGRPPDFLMCIGDDSSDEVMFESINSTASSSLFSVVPEVFTCTVGQKPSKTRYYVNDTMEVLMLLKGIADSSTQKNKDFEKQV